MTPSFTIATDNIYKFACLFGLALIISAVLSFATTYSSNLDRKVHYSELVIPLEAKQPRSKAEENTLQMYKDLLDVTRSNESSTNSAIGLLFGAGLMLSVWGAQSWYKKVQQRDDRFTELQMRKLEAEIDKLVAEVAPKAPPSKR